MKTLNDQESRLLVKVISFVQTLSSEDLVGLAESIGLPGQKFVEVCRDLDEIRNKLED